MEANFQARVDKTMKIEDNLPTQLSIEHIETLGQISQKVFTSPLAYIEQDFFHDLRQIIPLNRGILYEYRVDQQQFQCMASDNWDTDQIENALATAIGGRPGWVFSNRRPMFVESEDSKTRSIIMVPLLTQQQCLGCIEIETEKTLEQNSLNVHLLMLIANQLAAKLENHYLSESFQTSKRKYKNVFEKSQVPIFLINANGVLLEVNRSFINLVAHDTKDDLIGTPFTELMMNAKHRKAFQQRLTKRGNFKNFEAELLKSDGSTLTAHITGATLCDANGSVIGCTGFIKDFSEEHKMEMQLLQAQKLQAIGAITNEITHDFNNILGGIMGYASLILSDMETDNRHYDDIQTILEASRKAAALTSQLLSFSRKQKYQIKPVWINDVALEILTMISSTFKKIEIESNLYPDIAVVEADSNRLQQVLMNLCINARDAMPDGGVLTVETENVIIDDESEIDLAAGPYVLIRVTDTGHGMDTETVTKIFEPFFTTKENKSGSGLGLAISQRIIRSLGGEIKVESEMGKGTNFQVYMPASDMKVERSYDQKETDQLPRGKETILLVDDEEIIRTVSKQTLNKFGYKVLLASNGEEAVEVYRMQQNEIDLLILDMIMPRMDGKATFRELKQINPDIKVLLASGSQQHSEIELLKKEGVRGFIQKPFMAGQILRIIRETLDKTDQ